MKAMTGNRSARLRALGLLFGTTALVACPAPVEPAGPGGGGSEEPCELQSWHITKDTTLTSACGDYSVSGDVVVDNNATLTIEAGVQLGFEDGAGLYVGHDGPGRLIADGTADARVELLGNGASSWAGVSFGPRTLFGSVLEDVRLDGGGLEADEQSFATRGCVTVLAPPGAVSVKRSTLNDCGQAGLSLPTSSSILAELSEVTFSGGDTGVEAHVLVAATVGDDHTFESTTGNRLLGGLVDQTAVVPALGVPWFVDGPLVVGGEGSPMLILDAGADLAFERGAALEVGTLAPGGLIARGSNDASILLQPQDETWPGVIFGPSTALGSTLEWVQVQSAGERVAPAVEGCVSVDTATPGAVGITKSVFDACTGAGVAATRDGFAFAAFEDNGVAGAGATVGVRVAASVVGSIGANDFGDDIVENQLTGGAVTWPATWREQEVPWTVEDTITVDGEAAFLTLDAGLELRFASDAWLEVGTALGGSLLAVGAAGREVVLDSAAATPASGDWVGVVLGPMVGAGTRLEHVMVGNAGQAYSAATRGCVTLQSATPWAVSIVDSTFSDCGQAGVAATLPGVAFAQLDGNAFTDSAAGLWVHASAVGTVGLENSYAGTAHNILVGGALDSSAVWVAQDVPWDVDGRLEIGGASSPVLNIWAGTHLRFEEGGWLRVGALAPGGLIVEGLATDQVTFEAASGSASGSWVGLMLGAATTPGTSIDEAIVRHAGERVAAATQGAISLARTGTNVSITNVTFANNQQADVYVDCSSTPNLADNGFSAAGQVDEADCPVAP
jgi:hypothetical protein